VSLLIKNGTVVNPAKKQNEVADVLVKDGKIAAIGQNLSAEGAEVYDATGLIVAPGLIDIHTHSRRYSSVKDKCWLVTSHVTLRPLAFARRTISTVFLLLTWAIWI
jgi:dihydroorotase-like cyclic amidohydrolase